MSHQGLIQGNTVSKLCIIQTVIEKGAVLKRQRSLIDGKIVSLVLMTRALVIQLPLISRLIIFHIGYCSIVHNGSNGNLCSHTLCHSESLNSIHFMTLTPRFFHKKFEWVEVDWSPYSESGPPHRSICSQLQLVFWLPRVFCTPQLSRRKN